MSDDLGYELVDKLLLPLMSGGEVRLLPPIGSERARRCASMACSPDQEENLRRFKLAAARRLYPVDDVGGLSPSEWLLLCALNDTLQLTNPGLSRASHRTRVAELVRPVIGRAGAPPTVREALSRHALFARLPSLVRRDQHVTWWTGSRRFVGRRPPSRLLRWRSLRRVRVETESVHLLGLHLEPFETLLDDWLSTTPVTRLVGAALVSRFSWRSSTLALVSEHTGRQLALRAIVASDDARAVHAALDEAARSHEGAGADVAQAFSRELRDRLAQL